MLNVDLSNEEIAERIKAGNNAREYTVLLWERNKRSIYRLASRYENAINQHAFVDFDDLMQCGFLAVMAAVKAFNPEKKLKLLTYTKLCFKSEVHDMFGNLRGQGAERKKRLLPPVLISLNRPIEGGRYEMEEIETIEDEQAGLAEDNYEREETRTIVAAAVERLPDRQRFVIIELYYKEKYKTQLVDGVTFTQYSQVAATEDSALFRLRQDKALRALYFSNYSGPETPSHYGHTPERVVLAGETMDEWLKHISREIGRLQRGLQTASHNSHSRIKAV